MLVEGLRLHGPTAPVGRTVAYSNFGVSVLGEALGAAWGKSYEVALREHVLDPLGLKATTLGLAGRTAPVGLAPGHVDWRTRAQLDLAGVRTVWCGAKLCARHGAPARGLPWRRKGAAARRARATTQRQRPNDEGGSIGLGWLLTDDAERPVVWHNGATAGSHAFVAFSPKTGAGIAILANEQMELNRSGSPCSMRTIAAAAAAKVAAAASYAGRYPLSPTFAIDIRARGGALFAQATGQAPVALRETALDRFALTGIPAEISFERDADGKIVALVLHQNGMDLRGPRGEFPRRQNQSRCRPNCSRTTRGSLPSRPPSSSR